MVDTLAPLGGLWRAGERPEETRLEDLLVSWSEWSEDPAAVAALGEVTGDLEARIAALEARLAAALPAEERAAFGELLALHRQRAQEWGYSGVEFARRAIETLLR